MDQHSEQTCSRFSYLLEPIRDLTKNLEVDVAGQLDDYLSEVSSSTPAQWLINNINVYTCIYTYGIKEFGELRARSVYYSWSQICMMSLFKAEILEQQCDCVHNQEHDVAGATCLATSNTTGTL